MSEKTTIIFGYEHRLTALESGTCLGWQRIFEFDTLDKAVACKERFRIDSKVEAKKNKEYLEEIKQCKTEQRIVKIVIVETVVEEAEEFKL